MVKTESYLTFRSSQKMAHKLIRQKYKKYTSQWADKNELETFCSLQESANIGKFSRKTFGVLYR